MGVMDDDKSRKELKRINQTSDIVSNKVEIRIEKWKNTKFWAIWINQDLLAVAVYKKGAIAVKSAILALQRRYAGQWEK